MDTENVIGLLFIVFLLVPAVLGYYGRMLAWLGDGVLTLVEWLVRVIGNIANRLFIRKKEIIDIEALEIREKGVKSEGTPTRILTNERVAYRSFFWIVAILLGFIIILGIVSSLPSNNKTIDHDIILTENSQALPPATAVKPTSIVAPTLTPTPMILTGRVVKTGSLRVRSCPGTRSNVLGGFTQDTALSLIGRNEDASWVLVSSNNLSGWVSSEFLATDGDVFTLKIGTNTVGGEDVLCKDTQDYIDQFTTCKIPKAYCTYRPDVRGKPTFCNDAPYSERNFALIVWESDRSDLDGKCLLVTGCVSLYDGIPEIIGRGGWQISDCP